MNRLSIRLTIAFLLTAWISVGALALVVQRTLESGFRQYVSARSLSGSPPGADQAAELEAYYAAVGSWDGVEAVLGGRGGAGRGASLAVVDLTGRVVAATGDRGAIGLTVDPAALAGARELTVDGVRVGWLLRQTPGEQALGAAEIAFLNEANRWLTLAGIGATILALGVGGALAWTLARPLRQLAAAARDLSTGQLGRQVMVRGTDEINQLVAEFNAMSQALARAEAVRRRMAADAAHELRTPVSVLRGQLEAMLDGVYPLDSAHIAVAHEQTIHLARLVDDLRVLTLAEARQLPLERTELDPAALVTGVIDAFAPLALDAGIALNASLEAGLPRLVADVTRLRQVLTNLLANALRHTPPGGTIRVSAVSLPGAVRISVYNSGSRLDAAEREHVFEPFWRAEAARERESGGSGLGLAISREIVALHGGSMTVTDQADGVTFSFTLPTA
ncbi:MAG: sensor histidine kinase [Candidatus Flexifilum sp.]